MRAEAVVWSSVAFVEMRKPAVRTRMNSKLDNIRPRLVQAVRWSGSTIRQKVRLSAGRSHSAVSHAKCRPTEFAR
jgi:hypothetical protein